MTDAAHVTINVSAIGHNLTIVKRYAPNAKIMAVIKANGYGHGLLRIAKALNNVDAIAVARIDEAIHLRKSGITKKIVILGGFVYEDEFSELLKYELDTVIHSNEQIKILENYKGQAKIATWLKLDSGMNRLGFKPTMYDLAYSRLLKCSNIKQPISLMTHFSSADERNRNTTMQQIKLFNSVVKDYSGERSMANSAGLIAWPDSLTDWVRPGIMLYGISPFVGSLGDELGLKPVMSLYARLISVKTIQLGDAVGYGEMWVNKSSTKLGVVSIGYGDGYPRAAKQGTPVLVNGQRVPLVGRVSMDMLTVDLSTLPESRPGDKVTLWGEGLPVEEIALASDTIPYTLLCGVTQRVRVETLSV